MQKSALLRIDLGEPDLTQLLPARELPSRYEAVGTVYLEGGTPHLLVRRRKLPRVYFALDKKGDVVSQVDGRTVAARRGTIGRPKELNDGRILTVTLGEKALEAARILGDGNVSEGVRRALAYAAGEKDVKA